MICKIGAKETPMRQFFIIVAAFVLGGCNSAKDIGGVYHLISDDPALQRVTLEIGGTRVSGQGLCHQYLGSITHSDTGSNSIQVGRLPQQKWPVQTYRPSIAISKICSAFLWSKLYQVGWS
jgi:hypothetical protein